MVMISIPILTSQKNENGETGISDRTEYYTTAKVCTYSVYKNSKITKYIHEMFQFDKNKMYELPAKNFLFDNFNH